MQHNDLEISDVEKCRALRSVLSQCEFPLKGDAVVKVAMLLQWFQTLDVRIEKAAKDLKASREKTVRKELK